MYPSHEEALKAISMLKLIMNIRYRTRLQQSMRSSILDIISYECTSNEILISCKWKVHLVITKSVAKTTKLFNHYNFPLCGNKLITPLYFLKIPFIHFWTEIITYFQMTLLFCYLNQTYHIVILSYQF